MPDKKKNNDLEFGDLENEFFSSGGFADWDESTEQALEPEPEPEPVYVAPPPPVVPTIEETASAFEASAEESSPPLSEQASDFSNFENSFFTDDEGADHGSDAEGTKKAVFDDDDVDEDDEEYFAAAEDFVDSTPDQSMILRRSARPLGFNDDEVAAALAERDARRQNFASPTLHPEGLPEEELESSSSADPVLPPVPERPDEVLDEEPADDTEEISAEEQAEVAATAKLPELTGASPVPSFIEESPTVAAVPAMPVLQMPSPPLDVSTSVGETPAAVVVAPPPVVSSRTFVSPGTEQTPAPSATRYKHEEGALWSEAIDVLLKQARVVEGEESVRLIAEAGHISFSRLGDWARAGELFEEACALGHVEPALLKAFGDVAASNGDLDKLLELLLKRAELTSGAAAAEALQDAVLVERKRLRGEQDTSELVALLQRSLELVPGDWFALRLLREMERRQENWNGLLNVLHQMSELASGSRAARLMVERGRIFEDELNQLDEAEKCYAAARDVDPALTSAFLAAERVARLRGDDHKLSELYQEEAARLGDGQDAAFWMSRAARAAALSSGQDDGATELYELAIEMSDPADRPLRHEAQRFYARTKQWDALVYSIREEADNLEGAERAFVLYRLGRLHEEHLQDADAALEAYIDAAGADATAGPAVEAASRLLTEQGRWEKLRSFLSEVVTNVDDQHVAVTHHYRLAELSEGPLNDQESSRHHFEQILAVDEGYLPALEGLERVYTRLSAWDSLATVYERRALLAEDERGAALQLHRAGAVFEFRLAQMDKARALYERALSRVPDFPASLDALVRILETEGEWDALAKALAEAATASSDTNEVVSLAYRAARVYTERVPGSHAEAVRCLERCLALQPGFLPAIALLRELSERSGDWGKVYLLHRQEADTASDTERRHWRMLAAAEAAERSDSASPIHVLEEILAEDSTHTGAFSALEEQALQGGDLNTLLSVYQRMLVSLPDSAVRSSVGARLAAVARESGDIVRAIQAVGEVIAADGARPLHALSRIAESLNHWEKAREALSASGGSLTEQARLLESYGGETEACVEAWRGVLAEEPNNTDAAAGLERALSRAGSREGMAEAHALLAEKLPDAPIQSFHALLAGHLHEALGQSEDAIRFYRLAFSNRPQLGKAFDALRRLYAESNDAQAMRDLFIALPVSDPAALASALEEANDASAAADIYKDLVDADAANLGLLIRWEKALQAADRWSELFDVLSLQLNFLADDEARALIESKRRWVLAEKLADTEEASAFYERLYEDNPTDPEVLEALARIAGARGDIDKATSYLDGLVSSAVSLEEASRYQRRIADINLDSGEKQKARAAYEAALELYPQDLESLTALKQMSRDENDWRGLVDVLSREADTAPDAARLDCYREIATIWEDHLDDKDAARESWERLLQFAPNDIESLQHIVDIARSTEDWAALIQSGRQLVQLIDGEPRASLMAEIGALYLERFHDEAEAVRFLDAASLSQPPSLEAARTLERIYTARGAYDMVITVVRRQATASPDSEEAVALLLRAAELRMDSVHDRSAASEIFEEILTIDPDNPHALEFQAEHLYRSERYSEAIELFTRLEPYQEERDLDDDFDEQIEVAMFFFRFADALSRQGESEQAMTRYVKALECNASHLPSLEAVGPLYMASSRWDDAARVYRQILQLTGGQGDPERLARTYTSLGLIEHRLGKLDKAKKRFNRALELKSNDIGALQGIADVLYDRSDWTNLLNVYNNIIYHAQEPGEVVSAYLTKGYVLDTRLNLPEKAEQHYRKSLDFDPSLPNAQLRLAELSLRKQDWPRAAGTADQGLSISTVSGDIAGGLHLVKAIAHKASSNDAVATQAYHTALQLSATLSDTLDRNMGTVQQMHEALRKLLMQRP